MPCTVVCMQKPVEEIGWCEVDAMLSENFTVCLIKKVFGINQHTVVIPQQAFNFARSCWGCYVRFFHVLAGNAMQPGRANIEKTLKSLLGEASERVEAIKSIGNALTHYVKKAREPGFLLGRANQIVPCFAVP